MGGSSAIYGESSAGDGLVAMTHNPKEAREGIKPHLSQRELMIANWVKPHLSQRLHIGSSHTFLKGSS